MSWVLLFGVGGSFFIYGDRSRCVVFHRFLRISSFLCPIVTISAWTRCHSIMINGLRRFGLLVCGFEDFPFFVILRRVCVFDLGAFGSCMCSVLDSLSVCLVSLFGC